MNNINLTTGADNLTGTSGDDTFVSTYNDDATAYTFGIADVLDGGAGIDTLDIETNHVAAITPLDSYWGELTHIEKLVIHGGAGAQTITTAGAFEASFAAAGIDLTSESLAGAITLDMKTFTGTAAITTTSTGGAQTITSGIGATTVVAVSTDGAETITGTGLTSVTATSTHGAQTISGVNLTSVVATSGDGAQTITGMNLVTVIAHTAGAQTITTGPGAHVITASAAAEDNAIVSKAGNDVISVDAATGGYHIRAGGGHDLINGGTGNDFLDGGAGKDTINAGAGNDVIFGGAGRDTLSGGAGNDDFLLSANGFDTITDFSVANDTIRIDHSVFTALTSITADNLVIGAHAADANDFLAYNSNSGKLSYDADGNGAGHAVVIAVLGTHLELTSSDFMVI